MLANDRPSHRIESALERSPFYIHDRLTTESPTIKSDRTRRRQRKDNGVIPFLSVTALLCSGKALLELGFGIVILGRNGMSWAIALPTGVEEQKESRLHSLNELTTFQLISSLSII